MIPILLENGRQADVYVTAVLAVCDLLSRVILIADLLFLPFRRDVIEKAALRSNVGVLLVQTWWSLLTRKGMASSWTYMNAMSSSST